MWVEKKKSYPPLATGTPPENGGQREEQKVLSRGPGFKPLQASVTQASRLETSLRTLFYHV